MWIRREAQIPWIQSQGWEREETIIISALLVKKKRPTLRVDSESREYMWQKV